MATVIYRREAGTGPTLEQINELRRAAARPITYDEDAPKLTAKELAEFRRVNAYADRRETAAV